MITSTAVVCSAIVGSTPFFSRSACRTEQRHFEGEDPTAPSAAPDTQVVEETSREATQIPSYDAGPETDVIALGYRATVERTC